MKKILIQIGKFFSVFRGLSRVSKSVVNIVYTGYCSKGFCQFGCSKIEYPANQIVGRRYITVGNNTVISKSIILTAFDKRNEQTFTPRIIIGDNCVLGECMHITAVGSIQIGDNVLTGRYCLITDNSHGNIVPEENNIHPIDRAIKHKDVHIGNNVWIGDSVCILPGVNIGDGAIVGAGSIVTKDIPSCCVAVGNPAKIIKQL